MEYDTIVIGYSQQLALDIESCFQYAMYVLQGYMS